MMAIGKLLLAIAVALMLIAGAVFGLEDRQVLVPPPEAVAEGFARAIAAGRYEQARPFLSTSLSARTSSGSLREMALRLKQQVGSIEQVQGEPAGMHDDHAAATAVLQTERAGAVTLRFGLTRRAGTWAISDLGPLDDGR